jgi:2-polyprenyl-3-methyl-5-hydroxy-6-metoxy-1,4-benzoquinol methylase
VNIREPFWYNGRDERAEFAAHVFYEYFGSSVLDVGCWKQDLKDELPNKKQYTGIDIAGDPDIKINLEEKKLEHFNQNQFETIACLDVLEHIDNIHEVFDDICRVASDYAILSLPNNYMMNDMKKSILTGQTVSNKFYGLPPEEPEDRHKWFFNYIQAKKFIYKRAKKNNAKIIGQVNYPEDVPLTIIEKFKRIVFRAVTAPFYGKGGYNNLLVSTLWVVLDTSNS